MLTEPSVALTVPLALIARLQTGKPHRRQRLDVAAAAVDDQRPRAARLEGRGQQLAEEAVGALGGTAATTTSPGRICSAATCSIQLSPGCRSTVTAVPRHLRAGVDRAQHGVIRPTRPIASCTVALPKAAELVGDVGVGALDVAIDDSDLVHGSCFPHLLAA